MGRIILGGFDFQSRVIRSQLAVLGRSVAFYTS